MNKLILIIDDEDDIREIAQVSLELMAGFQVITASFGKEGIDKALTEQPDAILLDVMLPDMDGIAIFHELQANPKTAQIPIIFLTAKVQPHDQIEFAELAVKAVISKPFKPTSLAQQLKTILGWLDA